MEKETYSGEFAAGYDHFMNEIPYEKWADQITEILRSYEIEDGILAELGCGTGTMTRLLADAGFDLIGIDYSEDMLTEAREHQANAKPQSSEKTILYLEQDMREFELYGTVRGIVAVADTMNYLTDPDDFLKTLKLVNNYLDPDGLFLFDLKTEFCYREVLGNQTYVDEDEQTVLIWENQFVEEEKINTYAITTFHEEEDGRYFREDEYHIQRAYSLQEIRSLAEQAGLRFIRAVESVTGEEVKDDSERILVVLQEQGKGVN